MNLVNDNFVETTAFTIQGQYVGQTSSKVEELMEQARGGILFVDEAHELMRSPFSREAAKVLMTKTLEPEHEGKTMIIFAGYKAELERMLASVDPGMLRRFKGMIEFP